MDEFIPGPFVEGRFTEASGGRGSADQSVLSVSRDR